LPPAPPSLRVAAGSASRSRRSTGCCPQQSGPPGRTRAKLGVDAAQVLQAGILPNPPVAVSYPFFIAGPGITQDVKSILLLRTKGEAAQNAAAEISATLLWQEWQTIGKARLLFIDTIEGERAEKLIVQSRKFLQERFKLTSTAIGLPVPLPARRKDRSEDRLAMDAMI
jgi:hypothetical protein